MEEKTQTQLYSEFLIAKAKRLDTEAEIKEKIIKMLEYLGEYEGKKLSLVEGNQSELYLQIANSKLWQIAKNYDIWGTLMQKNTAIMLVKDLPEIYLEYKEKIEESILPGKKF